MRKPIENGFGFEVHAALVQHREGVARAVAEGEHDLLGRDRRAVGAAALATVTPRTCPSSISRSVTRWPKRISPPSASISARIFSTTPTSRKVPMCGLLT